VAGPGGNQSEEGKESVPAQTTDAGSIEQHGIELAVVIEVVMRSSCYDSP
jgi:hypothetical protein